MNKLKDILYAGALGDAFGYPIEFLSWELIKNRYGVNGFEGPEGRWLVSDDTQMTLYTLAAINRCPSLDPDRLTQETWTAYQEWRRTQSEDEISDGQYAMTNNPLMHYARAPGRTCLSALDGKIPGTVGRPINDSLGCGTVMRIAPLAFLSLPLDQIYQLSVQNAALTHGHVLGQAASGFFAVLLKSLSQGQEWDRAIQESIRLTEHYHSSIAQEWLAQIKMALDEAKHGDWLEPNEMIKKFGKGWIAQEAVTLAVYAVAASNTFTEALILSANHSGDSDSTASLAGQLYAAWKGLDEEARLKVSQLDVHEVIEAEWLDFESKYNKKFRLF